MTDHEVLQIYISLTPFLAEVCGSGAEIAVHDMTDPEHSLVAIKNAIPDDRSAAPLPTLRVKWRRRAHIPTRTI